MGSSYDDLKSLRISSIGSCSTYQICRMSMRAGTDITSCSMRQSSTYRAINGSNIMPRGYDMLYRIPNTVRCFFVQNSVTVSYNQINRKVTVIQKDTIL